VSTAKTQQTFDLDDPRSGHRRTEQRGQQRRDCEQVEIPDPPASWRNKPSLSSCRAVLMALDEMVRANEAWRVKISTLCERLGFKDRSTVQRALRWLTDLGFVDASRTGRSSLYTINRGHIARTLSNAQKTRDGAESPIRWGVTPHQMGRNAPSTTDHITDTPSTKPAAAEWCNFEQQLRAAGVYPNKASQLADQLQAHQVALTDAEAILAHWQEHGGADDPTAAWTCGALVCRLTAHQPGDDPASGWPPPSDAWEARQGQAARDEYQEASRAERIAEEQRLREEQQQAVQLEASAGPILDSFDVGDIRALAARLWPGNEFQSGRFYRNWKQRGSYERQAALEAIANDAHFSAVFPVPVGDRPG